MTELEHEQEKLNALIEKYGIDHEFVLKQSQIVDELSLKEMNK